MLLTPIQRAFHRRFRVSPPKGFHILPEWMTGSTLTLPYKYLSYGKWRNGTQEVIYRAPNAVVALPFQSFELLDLV